MPSNQDLQLHPLLPSLKFREMSGCVAKRLQHMKRLLATSIALSMLGALPVVAETALESIPTEGKSSTWLILVIGNGSSDGSLLSLQMKSMDQCEEQGAVWMSSNRAIKFQNHRDYVGFECLEGK